MVQAPARDFPIPWRQPEDAGKLWAWDGMHCPRPLTPLSIDFATAVMRVERRLSGRPEDPAADLMFVNGYFYQSFQPPAPDASPDPKQKALEEQLAAEAKDMGRLWQRRWLPQVRRICRGIAVTGYHDMSDATLIRALTHSVQRAGHAFALTLRAAGPMFAGIQKFYEFCDRELGAGGIGLAGEAVQGYHNASSASDAALWDLSRLALRLKLDGLVLSTAAEELSASLESGAEGRMFRAALNRYLDRYGWRTPTWWELSEPPWREAPAEPLRLVQRYLRGEMEAPRTAIGRVAARRRAALKEARQRLTANKIAEFEELWRTARQFVPVSEGRALWQLSLGGYLRLPALTLGERLQSAGLLDSASDVFYLTLDELTASEDAAGWAALTQRRRQDRRHWLTVVPPLTIGRMPQVVPSSNGGGAGAPMELPFGVRMVSGFGGERSTDERVLKGHAASPGVVQGRARVVETVAQADKVEPGDILVCRFTTPSWAHLFSRVSAIVADSGGVLSHCAILAREYGIPCVPGVRVGTRRIRDGMLITVDGSQGIVRLEET